VFDPEDPRELSKLCNAIEASDEKLRPHREQRRGRLKQYVGKWYGDDGAPDNVPLNMIELGVNIFQRGLSSHFPRARVTSDYDELLPEASNMQLALNQQAERLNIKDAFNTCAVDALFSAGMMKIGITAGETPADGEGYLHDPGNVFADPVLFEDVILDMSAKRREKMAFVGDKFSVPLEWAKENSNYDKEARKELTASEPYENDSIDSNLGRDHLDRDEFEPMVNLRQIFLTRHNRVLVLAPGNPRKILQQIEWNGPEGGPYVWLGFGKVPGNLIPLAPVPLWSDLHSMTNELMNKAWRQADRQKTFTAIPPAGVADANTIVDISDGEARFFNEPDKIKEISTGGANRETLAMSQLAKSLLVYMGGNWDALGGLAAQSRTVGQDELLASGAGGRMQDMQQTMLEFQVEVYRHLAFWLWEDAISEYHLLKPVADTKYSVPTIWRPENRKGRFFEKNFKIGVFAEQNRTPAEQGSLYRQLVAEVLMQAAPMMQQQGMGINWEYVIKTLGEYANTPELRRSVIYLNGEQTPQGSPQDAGMPAQTKRTYERVNRPAASRPGADATLINTLMGGGAQDSEMSALFASTS
jgi:hypothetical protein